MTTRFDADIDTLVEPGAKAFALLHRPWRGGADEVEVLVGDPLVLNSLADLPLPALDRRADRPDLLAVVPFRQVTERGLHCVDDGEPLIALQVRAAATLPVADALRRLPAERIDLTPGDFDVSDEDYQAVAARVLATNIGCGDGSNFVIRRTFRTTIAGYSPRAALAFYRRLLRAERGAYWTFLVHWNGRTLIGATPECQVRIDEGIATMNPISGTYRYPESGPDVEDLRRFLADRKESEELLMVVDEELKMMARVCEGGGRVRGPSLRPMSRLAHTEYHIDGPSRLDVRDVLRLTLPAPTVSGSPLATACRIIAAHERIGRGYYGGALALIGQRGGQRTLDSSLLIRVADVSAGGKVAIGVGATLVRHSDPAAEAAETTAKAKALLGALGWHEPLEPPVQLAGMDGFLRAAGAPPTRRALAARNAGLSRFWRGLPEENVLLPKNGGAGIGSPVLTGRRLLVIDAGDDFTEMLARLAGALGLAVRVVGCEIASVDDVDLVIVGPGPGDPGDRTDPKIARLHALTRRLLATRTPFVAVCLGHQVLADEFGLGLHRMAEPAQGVQRRIPWDGRLERVGLYHTFQALSDADALRCPVTGDPVLVLRDPLTGAVHGLSKPGVRSVQFHVESVLTEHGPAILRRLLTSALSGAVRPVAPSPQRLPTRHR